MHVLTEKILDHQKQDIFTDRDLRLLLKGNDASRYGLVKRALKSGEIIRLKRGFYCLSRKYQRKELNLFSLSQTLYGPSYVSLESALSYYGWIPEGVFQVTNVSHKKSMTIQNSLGVFNYARIPLNVFYEHVDRVEEGGNVFFIARPFKAVCDYVYIHKCQWITLAPLEKSLRVEIDNFKTLTTQELNDFEKNYRSQRVRRFIRGVKTELGL